MIQKLRTSFAAKLVALEVGTIFVAVIALGGLLIVARLAQTRELERNVARSSVDGLRRELADAGTNATGVSSRLAAFAPFVAAFPGTVYGQAEARTLTEDQSLVILDGSGKGIAAFSGGQFSAALAPDRWNPAAAVGVLAANPDASQGLVTYQGARLELDGIGPVDRQGSRVGYVLDAVDLQALLRRLTPSGSAVQYSLFYGGRRVATTFGAGAPQALPSDVQQAADQGGGFTLTAIGGKTYAGYYAAINQAGGQPVLLGAEVDDSLFAAQNLNDILVVVFTTTLLGTILSIAAVLFARRYALRPLRRLDEGAGRLGAGEYSTRVLVPGDDDFSRLARDFNHMAQQIEASTAQLEQQRARLDNALSSLGSVSRALTTTPTGRAGLRQAILEAVAEITGAPMAAMYRGEKAGQASATVGVSQADARRLLAQPEVAGVLDAGGGLVQAGWPGPPMRKLQALVIPMVSQGRRSGAIAAFAESGLDDVDVPALTVLASQATVALENAELFERERETVERLQELDSMKSDFLATIQHELRTPLTAIIGLTDLLAMAWSNWTDAQKLDSLSEVQQAAKSLYDIVETILDFSMLESDRLRLTLMPCRLHDAAVTAVDELEPTIKRQRAKVRVEIPKELTAQADARRLAQVARALIDNAVKFSPEGATVDVVGGRDNGQVFLRVSDRGIGIEPEDQQRIFERFFQVDNTATRRYGGTGMGLALVDRLVAMHHGKVKVESVPGEGSTFTVFLPAAGSGNGKGHEAKAAPIARLESKRSR